MREILSDIVRQTGNLFDIVKITGTDDATRLEGQDADKSLFLKGSLKTPAPALSGEFGLSNLPLLAGLLNFSSYKADTATFTVKRENKRGVGETVSEFQFRDANKTGSNYKTTAAQACPEQAVVSTIPWEVQVEPSKAKIAEFAQLAALYSDIKEFGIETVDGNLIFSLGDENATTHNATMVFASGVTGTVKASASRWNISQFLAIMKMAGSHKTTISISARTVIGLSIETENASYMYYMRAKR